MAHKLQRPLSKNTIDNLTDALIGVMKFADNSVEYPDLENVKSDDGVIAEWFYPICNGNNDFSELTAILMYTAQEAMYDEIGELMLGIGLVEMKHYAKLNDLILKLGGKIDQRYNNGGVVLGESILEALEIAYNAEVKTIKFYESIINKIEKVKTTKTITIALQLIEKLIADERVHQTLLQEALSEFSKKEEKLQETLDNLTEE